MKKLLLLLMVVLMVICSSGCGVIEKAAQGLNYESMTDCFGDIELIYPDGTVVIYNSVWIEYAASAGSIVVIPESGGEFTYRGNFKFIRDQDFVPWTERYWKKHSR